MYSMIGGIYGMNLRNGAEDSHSTFMVVNALCGAGSVLGFGLIMLYIRSKRWM
jgi:Mg2+ and Co2+ transporter CorA